QYHQGANLLVVTGYPEALEVTSKIVKALGVSSPEPLSTRVFAIRYAQPGDLIAPLRLLLTDKRSNVVSDSRTSQLVVMATPTELANIINVVERLDVPDAGAPKSSGANSPVPGMPPGYSPSGDVPAPPGYGGTTPAPNRRQ